MSYPTFSFGAYAVPNFKTLCLYVTTNRDPFKYSLFSTRSARVFQTFHSEVSVVELKGVWLQIKLKQKVIILL